MKTSHTTRPTPLLSMWFNQQYGLIVSTELFAYQPFTLLKLIIHVVENQLTRVTHTHTLSSLTWWEAPSIVTIKPFQRFISYFHKKQNTNSSQQGDFIQTAIFFSYGLLSCRRINHCGQQHSQQHSLEPDFCGVSRVKRQYFTVTPGCLAAKWAANSFKCNCASPLMLAGLNCRKHSSHPLPNALAPVDGTPTEVGLCYAGYVGAGCAIVRDPRSPLPPSMSSLWL